MLEIYWLDVFEYFVQRDYAAHQRRDKVKLEVKCWGG